ncbi:SusC/RagA family TonB-linked outer membrane protein [Chitinophaga sp. YIM B06452]|uniref:SusC/RagA family TonB-linked outer membrane protein n=1 Tax=Chitinophaga sp. YIM B06452 TaxID=3082158 RepID=UPI0031FEBF7D
MTYIYSRQRKRLVLLLGLLGLGTGAAAQQKLYKKPPAAETGSEATNRLKQLPVSARDTIGYLRYNEMMLRTNGAASTLNLDEVKKLPYNSLHQMLLGRVTGADVRIPSAEPGKRSALFIRGASGLLLKNGDLFGAQPLYVVDGVPLINDHAFAYDIQRFDFNRLGSEIDPLVFLDMNDMYKVEVLKDFAASARYGPFASNGVVNISTRGPRTGELRVEVNGYAGIMMKPVADVINGRWERDFRLPFYDKYATAEQYRSFPAYLADSTNAQYYGNADWDEAYYRYGWTTGLQAAVSGGNRLASFRFSVGEASQQNADKTSMRRYSVNFGINITPVKRLEWSTFINAGMVNRKRNNSLRDRMGDEDYILNLERPPSPNKALLEEYYGYLEKGRDRNRNTSIRVLNNLSYNLATGLTFSSRFSIDYGQNFRDLFIPRTVNDGNSFVSNFDGIQSRMVLDNSLEYIRTLGKMHKFTITAGQYGQWDQWRYIYGKAYRGKSDYIQIYQPGIDLSPEGGSHNLRFTANFKDRIKANLASFYGNIQYDLASKYSLRLYLRYDGSSNVNPDKRWRMFPTLSAAWQMKEEKFLKDSRLISNMRLRLSAGRIGKAYQLDYYKGGPIYNVEAGWEGTPNMATYNAFPILNAAYETGYISPGLGWAYTDQLNAGLDVGVLKDRVTFSVDVYSKTDRDLLMKVPVVEELGYSGVVKNGMDIRNYGGELTVDVAVIRNKNFAWSTALNASANKTKLLALPDGAQDVVLGNRRFMVGKPVDKYWLLINDGIYNSASEIPQGRSYQGLPMKVGDPNWRDVNGDNTIDDKDRVISGTHNPAVQGGWANTLRYRQLELNMLFAYAFGRKLINEALAQRFDFVNREGADAVAGIKEVFYWSEPEGDLDRIPKYNPWSPVQAYQPNQTLFLEEASFVRLRSLTLTYNFSPKWIAKNDIRQLRVYVTGNNLLTWTRYSGGDPEAFDYFGYDQGGYNWPQPKSFTLGFNLQF